MDPGRRRRPGGRGRARARARRRDRRRARGARRRPRRRRRATRSPRSARSGCCARTAAARTARPAGWRASRPGSPPPRTVSAPRVAGTPGGRCWSRRTTTRCASTTATRASWSRRAPGRVGAAFERRGAIVTFPPSRLGGRRHGVRDDGPQGARGRSSARPPCCCPRPDSPLLTRELLYTAVTRAQQRLVLAGSEEAVRTAVGAARRARLGAAPAACGADLRRGGGVCGGVDGDGTPAARLAARNAVCESGWPDRGSTSRGTSAATPAGSCRTLNWNWPSRRQVSALDGCSWTASWSASSAAASRPAALLDEGELPERVRRQRVALARDLGQGRRLIERAGLEARRSPRRSPAGSGRAGRPPTTRPAPAPRRARLPPRARSGKVRRRRSASASGVGARARDVGERGRVVAPAGLHGGRPQAAAGGHERRRRRGAARCAGRPARARAAADGPPPSPRRAGRARRWRARTTSSPPRSSPRTRSPRRSA